MAHDRRGASTDTVRRRRSPGSTRRSPGRPGVAVQRSSRHRRCCLAKLVVLSSTADNATDASAHPSRASGSALLDLARRTLIRLPLARVPASALATASLSGCVRATPAEPTEPGSGSFSTSVFPAQPSTSSAWCPSSFSVPRTVPSLPMGVTYWDRGVRTVALSLMIFTRTARQTE
jgi:hypothetical protein